MTCLNSSGLTSIPRAASLRGSSSPAGPRSFSGAVAGTRLRRLPTIIDQPVCYQVTPSFLAFRRGKVWSLLQDTGDKLAHRLRGIELGQHVQRAERFEPNRL